MSQPFSLVVDGMHCDGCVNRVKKALEKMAGVRVEDVRIGAAKGWFDPEESTASMLKAALKSAGYTARMEGELG